MARHDERPIKRRDPHLGACCDPARQTAVMKHRLCGGWWCTCPCHDEVEVRGVSHISSHVGHEWQQVGSCVYCCGERLFHGAWGAGARANQVEIAEFWNGVAQRAAADWLEMRAIVLAARREPTDG